MATESEEQLRKLLETLGQSIDDTADVFEEADRVIKKFSKDLKEIQPAFKGFKDFLSGTKKELDDMSMAAKKFDAAINQAREAFDTVKEAEYAQAKAQTLNRMATTNAKTASLNFAIGLGGVAKTMLSGAVEFVKGLQGTAEGTELTGQAALRAAEATGKLATEIGSLMDAIGMIAMVLGPGKIIKGIGVGLSLLGIGIEKLGPAATEAATEGLKILNTEVEKTKKAFRDITSTGAEFAGGMTQLRQISFEAGLDIGQLSTIVKSNNENLSNMGLGVAESIKRFSGINKELRNSQLGIQLRKLGLSTEEQGEMAIQTAAMLNVSGRLRNMSDKEVASTTVEYTKYLKILSNLTGEDAKKKLEDARSKALEVDVLAQLMSTGGEEAVKKFQAQYASLPDVLKKGYLELISTGGQAIVDGSTNVFLAQVPQARTQLQTMFADLSQTGIGFKEAGLRALELSKITAEATTAARNQLQPIGTAGRVIGDGLAQGASDIANGVILFNTKFAEGTVRLTETAVEAAARNQKALDSQMATIDELSQKLKADLGNALTGPITTYTGVLAAGTQAIKNFETAINSATAAVGSLPRGEASPQITPTTNKSTQEMMSKALTGKDTKGKEVGFFESWFNAVGAASAPISPGFAQGGISTGPLGGYSEVLHGTEAVVPLPDNRSIPVTLTNKQSNSNGIDTKEMVSAINQQSGLLNQILVAMERNNQLTSGILQTSY